MEHLVRGRAVNRYLNTSRVLHHRLTALGIDLVGRYHELCEELAPLPAFIALFRRAHASCAAKHLLKILYLEQICKTGDVR